MLPYEYLRRPKYLKRRWLRERLGFINEKQSSYSKVIWIHAVSMGEVIAAVPFVKELKDRYPSTDIVLSTVTDTGQKVARERLPDISSIIYVPFDLNFIIKRAFMGIRPDLFINMETELWPNLLRFLNRENVPVLIMNGRISEKSFRRYKAIGFFMKEVLRSVDLFCMQDGVYAARIRELGAAEDRIKVTGNFKFDTKPKEKIPEWTRILKGPVIIAGSTHPTEEGLVIDAYQKLKPDFPQINLIIAPRHPERFKAVAELIKKKGLEFLKVSEINMGQGAIVRGQGSGGRGQNAEVRMKASNYELRAPDSGLVILLDSVGELASAYGAADVAVIGGSFIEHGGQNPLEPAFWGKAIVCGRHMNNFPFIEEFYKKSAAKKTTPETLYETLKELIAFPEMRKDAGEKAKALYFENAGAVNRAVEIIGHYIPA